MTTELSRDVDAHIVSLLSKIATLHETVRERPEDRKLSMSIEARSLELWRAVAVECFATFLFGLLVLGAATSSNVYGSGLSVLATAVASGFGIAAVYFIFGHVSGGHVNPAVSISFALSRKISPLRAALYIAAQCGGGIAGAAILYGITGTDSMPFNTRSGTVMEKLFTETVLSILVVLAHLASDPANNLLIVHTKSGGILGATYTAATLVKSPFLNPARALGPAFVSSRWESHWVYWIGPIAGGVLSALLHEYVLNPKRSRESQDIDDADNSSMRSDEDTYDDFDKPAGPKFAGSYATYRPVAGASASIYSAPPSTVERVESIYGGTKSLYCKSPPLTRANLNRSQSVYTKSSSSARDGFVPKPGPLMPAQSLYHMRISPSVAPTPSRDPLSVAQASTPSQHGPNQSQNHNSTNQNMQNQLQQCTQNIYGIRGISTSLSSRENGIYGVTAASSIYGRPPAPPPSSSQTSQSSQSQSSHQLQSPQQPPGSENPTNSKRPESMYGHVSRRSDDSAYGSYQGSNRSNYGKIGGPLPQPTAGPGGMNQYRDQLRPSPGPLQQNQVQQGNFQRNSPNPQY